MVKLESRKVLRILKDAIADFLSHVQTPDDLPSREPYKAARARVLDALVLANETLGPKRKEPEEEA